MSNSNKEISKPEIFGPGMWYSIHISAIKMGEEQFLNWVRIIISNIPCLKCKNHATEYLGQNSPELYLNTYNQSGDLIGMFKWTWQFHNDVNKRLGKKILDYTTAYKMYTDESVLCSSDCGN